MLNPRLLFAHDVDALEAVWMELRISHDFGLFEGFTRTPSAMIGMDHRYLDRLADTGSRGATRLAYIQYGLTASYELGPILQLPECMGMTLSGFIYLNDALGQLESHDVIQDELFGGVSVGLSFQRPGATCPTSDDF